MTFEADLEESLKTYELLIGAFASRTRNMIAQYGDVESLSRLVVTADIQPGFKVLNQNGKLQATFEAVITRHPAKFRKEIVDAAVFRLENADALDKIPRIKKKSP
jgi:hypothetical protein